MNMWYWENRWAKASFLPGCHDENHLKIIPVYFWPGETVVLPCRMCQMAYLMNGRMKRWGYSEDIDEFLLHPKQFVRVNELWQDVENTKYFDQSNVPDPVDPDDVIYYPHEHDATNPKNITSRVKEPPRYWQNDGKLTIFSADVRSQGVYFCFDEFSRKQTSLFFVLSAMLPPVHFTTDVPTRYTDHCGSREDSDYKLIAASHNWRYHFYPMGDMNPPPTCAIDERDKEECVEKYPYLRKEMWPKNFDDECSMDRCRARLVSPEDNIDLFIELRWDAWTSCKGDKPTKRREGHCYLVRGRGSINIEAMSSDEKKLYSWIRNIETIFDRKPFDIDGIRLFRI
uniref:Uncharacterized protein n=1 Tax=Caenorhabditis japonica TaxID=281687 RepID=A0A8R1I220_CAEJA